MSGSRAKKERQSKRERPDYLESADYTLRAANAVLAVDLGEVPVSRVSQLAVGQLRAAFEQSRIIAILTSLGIGTCSCSKPLRVHSRVSLRSFPLDTAGRRCICCWVGGQPRNRSQSGAHTLCRQSRLSVSKTPKPPDPRAVPPKLAMARFWQRRCKESRDFEPDFLYRSKL